MTVSDLLQLNVTPWLPPCCSSATHYWRNPSHAFGRYVRRLPGRPITYTTSNPSCCGPWVKPEFREYNFAGICSMLTSIGAQIKWKVTRVRALWDFFVFKQKACKSPWRLSGLSVGWGRLHWCLIVHIWKLTNYKHKMEAFFFGTTKRSPSKLSQ